MEKGKRDAKGGKIGKDKSLKVQQVVQVDKGGWDTRILEERMGRK